MIIFVVFFENFQAFSLLAIIAMMKHYMPTIDCHDCDTAHHGSFLVVSTLYFMLIEYHMNVTYCFETVCHF